MEYETCPTEYTEDASCVMWLFSTGFYPSLIINLVFVAMLVGIGMKGIKKLRS